MLKNYNETLEARGKRARQKFCTLNTTPENPRGDALQRPTTGRFCSVASQKQKKKINNLGRTCVWLGATLGDFREVPVKDFSLSKGSCLAFFFLRGKVDFNFNSNAFNSGSVVARLMLALCSFRDE